MALRHRWSTVIRPAFAMVATVSTVVLGSATVSAQEPVEDGSAVADSQTCIGTITASLAAESLPSGKWSAHGGCLTGDSFFEFVEGPILAKAAVSEVVYDDGHSGRIAAGVLTLGNGLGLGIVGVEDSATGVIKWSAVLDEFESDGDRVWVSGDGVAVFPIERATVSATLTGTGTDVKPFLEGWETDGPEPGDEVDPADEAALQTDVDDDPADGSASDDSSVPNGSEPDAVERSDSQPSSDDGNDRAGSEGSDGTHGDTIGAGITYDVIEGAPGT